MAKLTKNLVEQAKVKDKNYFLWDDEIKGFGCLILASGAKRTYHFMYRSPSCKTKAKIKIGCHGNVTVDFARKKALEFSHLVASGIDPRDKRKEEKDQQEKEEKDSILFKDFVEIFMKQYKAEESTITNHKSRLKCHIIPLLGDKPLTKITNKDIKEFAYQVADMNGKRRVCGQAIQLMRMIFAYAIKEGYLTETIHNPCEGVEMFTGNKRTRTIEDHEYPLFMQELDRVEKSEKRSYYGVNALRLALYMGLRIKEALNLKWENVHFDEGYVYIPKAKGNKESTRPLNPKARELLSALKRKEGQPYVFPGARPGKPLTTVNRLRQKICKQANIQDLLTHDLRHTFASYGLTKAKFDLYTVSKLLGHANLQSTTRYAHLDLTYLKKAGDQMAKIFR